MKKLFIILFIFLSFSSVSSAEVSQFSFITPEQVVAPGSLSQALTLQSQSSGGVSEFVVETMDLSFRSTSPTGKFVGASGKQTSKTMSKNTAKRTFYYTDPTSGKHTLTVTVTGRTSKKSFSVSQTITIGVLPVVAPNPVVIPPVSNIPIKHIVEVQKQSVQKTLAKAKPKPINVTPIGTTTISTSSISIASSSQLVAVVHESTPSPSALETMLWLPKKIWVFLTGLF